MASLVELHQAIGAQLATIPGLRTFDHPPQGVTPPVGFVVHTAWSPAAMGSLTYVTAQFDIVILTAESIRPQDGYQALMGFADWSGPLSVYQAVWAGNDKTAGTFGGLPNSFASVDPAGFRVLGVEEMDAFQMYGGAFAVTAKTKGT